MGRGLIGLLAVALVGAVFSLVVGGDALEGTGGNIPTSETVVVTSDPFDTQANTYYIGGEYGWYLEHSFYTDLPAKTNSICLTMCGVESLTRITLRDPQGKAIYSERDFSDEIDVRSVPVGEKGVYAINVFRDPGRDHYQFNTDTSDLYTYHNAFVDLTNVEIWVEVPRDINFTLWNRDMDDYGEIRIYKPDNSLYGVFTDPDYISGHSEWRLIDVESYDNPGLWRVTFTDLEGADCFLVDASCGGALVDGGNHRDIGFPFLKLHVKKPIKHDKG